MAPEADDLEIIPRSVRDKLDRAGIKLHLRDWQRFPLSERRRLRDQPCEHPAEVDRYRSDLEDLIRRCTGEEPEYC